MKRKVLITVNPTVTGGRRFSAMRKFVAAMDKIFDLLVIPINTYDFKSGQVRAFRRRKGGAFESVGLIEPEGDLWIVYADGYYLNHRRLGFSWRRDYFKAQLDFHHRHLRAGRVRQMVNEPEAEARTLKSWFTTLDARKTRIIPTHIFSCIDEVYDFQKKKEAIVVKPVWGGASTEVALMTEETDVRKFHQRLKRRSDRDLSDYCFQAAWRGDEKRLWFAGGRFVAGRRFRGRETPWEDWNEKCRVSVYNKTSHRGFSEDVAAAERLCKLAGISVGAIDFIGDRINEINGCGTVMTTMHNRRVFVDARPAFVEYFRQLVK